MFDWFRGPSTRSVGTACLRKAPVDAGLVLRGQVLLLNVDDVQIVCGIDRALSRRRGGYHQACVGTRRDADEDWLRELLKRPVE